MTATVFPAFRSSDADRTIALLEALGFTERLVVRDPEDPSIIVHAEFAHGDRGGVMFGSARRDGTDLDTKIGGASCYIVVETDTAVDEVFAAALAAGATAVREPADQPYSGREGDVRDHDGNLWAIGSYPGA